MLDKFVNARSIHKLANAKVNRMHVTKSDHLGTEPRNKHAKGQRGRTTHWVKNCESLKRGIFPKFLKSVYLRHVQFVGIFVQSQTNYLVGNLRHNLLNYSFFVNQKKLTKHQPNDGY